MGRHCSTSKEGRQATKGMKIVTSRGERVQNDNISCVHLPASRREGFIAQNFVPSKAARGEARRGGWEGFAPSGYFDIFCLHPRHEVHANVVEAASRGSSGPQNPTPRRAHRRAPLPSRPSRRGLKTDLRLSRGQSPPPSRPYEGMGRGRGGRQARRGGWEGFTPSGYFHIFCLHPPVGRGCLSPGFSV